MVAFSYRLVEVRGPMQPSGSDEENIVALSIIKVAHPCPSVYEPLAEAMHVVFCRNHSLHTPSVEPVGRGNSKQV